MQFKMIRLPGGIRIMTIRLFGRNHHFMFGGKGR